MGLVQDYVQLLAVLLAQARVAEVAQRDAQVVLTDAQAVLGVVVATVRVRARQRVRQGVALDARDALVIVLLTAQRLARAIVYLAQVDAQVFAKVAKYNAITLVWLSVKDVATALASVQAVVLVAVAVDAPTAVAVDVLAVAAVAQVQVVARVAINAQALVRAVALILVKAVAQILVLRGVRTLAKAVVENVRYLAWGLAV